MNRRDFLARGIVAGGTLMLARWVFGASGHRYRLAPENILSKEIGRAPVEIQEAYRFAIANRDTLRYIPCYCGCGESDGHTSNASCYFKDNSTEKNPVFDRMSLA